MLYLQKKKKQQTQQQPQHYKRTSQTAQKNPTQNHSSVKAHQMNMSETLIYTW